MSKKIKERGVVVGCDRKQEWLLPWWWSHYSACNEYPVAFMDFGMSEVGVTWCKSKGLYVPLSFDRLKEKAVGEETRRRWEARTGEGIWYIRSGWLKKPWAFIHSPFELSCWIDLDCEVKCDLDPLFNSLFLGGELAMVREPEFCQKSDRLQGLTFDDEITYNSGVVVFRRDSQILHHWMEAMIQQNEKYMGDQNALSRMIYLHELKVVELDPIYNWKMDLGPNPNGRIFHYSGDKKLEILKVLRSDFFIE